MNSLIFLCTEMSEKLTFFLNVLEYWFSYNNRLLKLRSMWYMNLNQLIRPCTFWDINDQSALLGNLKNGI